MNIIKQFSVPNFDELQKVYTVLKSDSDYKQNKLDIQFDFEKLEYTVCITDQIEDQKEIQVDISTELQVVYGDSVVENTPVLIKFDEQTDVVFIKNLVQLTDFDKHESNGKIILIPQKEFYVWSSTGWTAVKKVISHITNKKIYQVQTQTGIVQTTQDHSLLSIDHTPLKPTQIFPDTQLLHGFPEPASTFGADIYDYTNQQTLFYFKKDNTGILESARQFYQYSVSGFHVSIVETEKDYVLVLNPSKTEKDYCVKQIKVLQYKTRRVYDIETESGDFQAGIGNLLVHNTDSVMIAMNFNRSDPLKNRADAFKLGDLCADQLTNKVFNRKPIEMECENIYNPFILLTRKRYTAIKYEDRKDPSKSKGMITKGLATTRRDHSPFVQETLSSIINCILNPEPGISKQDIVFKCIKLYYKALEKINKYDIPFEKIVTSSLLKKHYKGDPPAHVVLAGKLKERKQEVQINDRLQFIFIEPPADNPKEDKRNLAEDISFIRKHNLKINREIYTTKLAKVILGFFKVILSKQQIQDLLNKTNEYLQSFGGELLKESQFKVIEDDD